MCSHMSSSELRHCFNDSLLTLSNTEKFAATDDRGKAELEGTRAVGWRGAGAKGGGGGHKVFISLSKPRVETDITAARVTSRRCGLGQKPCCCCCCCYSALFGASQMLLW